MNILSDYKKAWQKVNKDSIYLSVDMAIAKYGIQNGYKIDEIKREIAQNSLYLKEHNENIEEYFNKLKLPIEQKDIGQKAVFSYDEIKSKYSKSIMNLYVKKELLVAQILLEQGYKSYDIQNILKQKSPYFDTKISKENKLLFINTVLSNLSTKEQEPKYTEYLKMYKEATSVMQKKNNSTINMYLDGRIATELLINHKVPLESLKQILTEHTANEIAKQPAYANLIVASLKNVTKRYEQITNFTKKINEKDNTTVAEKYLAYAHQYIHYQEKNTINGRDDQQLVKRLLAENVDKKDITAALLQYSPVAVQPGRDAKNYVTKTIQIVEKEYTQRVEKAKEHFKQVKEWFKQEHELIKEQIQKDTQRNKKESNDFYLGLLARNLIMKGAYPPYIIKNFEEEIPELKAKLPNTNNTYIYSIVEGAQKSVELEKSISNFISPYRFFEMELKDITSKNIPLSEVFKSVIKERIDVYPNVTLNLSRKYIDEDACIKLMNRYPGIKREELIKAVTEASVYNKLPGIDRDYPKKIVDTAIAKYQDAERAINDEKAKQKQLKDDFSLYKDVIQGAGITTSANKNEKIEEKSQEEQKQYCDCKAAVTMIKKHVSEVDVKNILADESNEKELTDKAKYADYIYACAKKVIAREIQIMNYLPIKESIEDTYKKLMKDEYLKKKYFAAELDVNVAKKMLDKQIAKEDIAITVIKNSPITAEPNKTLDYVNNYVLKKAEYNLNIEREKLKNYQPRLREETDINKAYRQHVLDLKNNIDLPFSKIADVIIASAMIVQNFSQKAIETALTEESALSPKTESNLLQNSYGKQIYKEAVHNLEKKRIISNTNEEYLGRERELTKK